MGYTLNLLLKSLKARYIPEVMPTSINVVDSFKIVCEFYFILFKSGWHERHERLSGVEDLICFSFDPVLHKFGSNVKN